MKKSISQLLEKARYFDFSKLPFHAGSNKIILRTDTGQIEAWKPYTRAEQAQKQCDIIYLGELSKEQAEAGITPVFVHPRYRKLWNF
jgi:hypothetical protein